ncbi:hypothetical protein GCM10010329_30270 [Streptomyces spiroverticillatus]|uniref:LppX_LprAFG lipoprotein n=1 Tax=Streptomyces finlayi TaxID=67296 RepID=A0A919C997_9ACTN|nr:LppX_LprAFG lipoprotein [Streptomyces finlayi]GHA05725.1 hypothetical protein GCM10010329_30270 [Streptomyces spiroverticillatus]GHC89523.1 hypothetical protein GCM10010334_22680 [Streptomyces finlayi]
MRRSALLISISGISALAVLGTACSSGSGTGTDGKSPASGAQAQKTSPAQTPAPTPTTPADPAAAVRAAVDAAGKSSARIDESIQLAGGGQDFTITVKGAFDMKADKGTLTAALSQTGGTKQVPLDEIFCDGTVYARMPSEGKGDTAWRAVERDKAVAHYLLRAPLNDPEHVLRQVTMAHDVTEVGEEKVNGTATVHYRGKLDSQALMLRMAQDRRALMEGPLKQMGDALPAFADVWVDKDGRIVRIVLACDLGAGKATATMNLSDHGTSVPLPRLPKNARSVPATSLGGPLGG